MNTVKESLCCFGVSLFFAKLLQAAIGGCSSQCGMIIKLTPA